VIVTVMGCGDGTTLRLPIIPSMQFKRHASIRERSLPSRSGQRFALDPYSAPEWYTGDHLGQGLINSVLVVEPLILADTRSAILLGAESMAHGCSMVARVRSIGEEIWPCAEVMLSMGRGQMPHNADGKGCAVARWLLACTRYDPAHMVTTRHHAGDNSD
jgi:hypothetical protein